MSCLVLSAPGFLMLCPFLGCYLVMFPVKFISISCCPGTVVQIQSLFVTEQGLAPVPLTWPFGLLRHSENNGNIVQIHFYSVT